MRRCKCKKVMAEINPNPMCWQCMKKEKQAMVPVIGPDMFSVLAEKVYCIQKNIWSPGAGIRKMELQYYGVPVNG